ncbi:hypothetical protein ACF09E_34680 [Streptomyces sp. NPDC014891]|uniref:hypothetical protein n=1 Tax=Streptomyces sp. NPDC014891 TaxID=3364929 RepID=UPI0036F93AFA
MDLEHLGSKVTDVISDGVTFTIITARLATASAAMLALSHAVKGAYDYVEGCAKEVDQLAEIAASLDVDDAVTSAHRDAATVMRDVLADADALATAAEEMAGSFQAARDGHEADYGPVQEAMTSKPGQIANRLYYQTR